MRLADIMKHIIDQYTYIMVIFQITPGQLHQHPRMN